MAALQLVYAPDPIFRQKAAPVQVVDDSVRATVQDMIDTMYAEKAVGIGANMVGVLQRIAVVDLMENDVPNPIVLINPTITWKSDDTQTHDEASICYPYISAPVTRAEAITVSFLDQHGEAQELTAEGFLATVIQHEIDYLDGRVFLDYVSKTKRDMLLKKMKKMISNPPHAAVSSCCSSNSGCCD